MGPHTCSAAEDSSWRSARWIAARSSVGIQPDVVVAATITGSRKDATLAAAIEVLSDD